MNITCKILNGNSSNYETVVINKFYQVVFWIDDFKEFHVYTGIVLGIEPRDGCKCYIDTDFDVMLKFNAILEDGTPVPIENISVQNISTKYTTETSPWQAVWGKDSKIVETHDELNQFYKIVTNIDVNFTYDLDNKFIYLTEEGNKSIIANQAI